MKSSLLNLTKTLPLCLTFFATSLIHSYGFAETKAHWIWPDKAEKSESAYFRKEIVLPAGEIKSAKLQATCDNGFKLFINEKQALSGDSWGTNYSAEVKKYLQPGKKNALAVEGINQGGVGGFVMKLTLDQGGKKEYFVTDTSWIAHRKFYGQWKKTDFGAKGWSKVIYI